VDLWEYCSTKSIAVRRDFYTSVADGKESDRIEKWLADEIETPAQAVLDKLTSRTPLTPQDRKKLARYIASLDARSPVYYRQHTEMMAELVPQVIDEVGKTIREAAEKRQRLPDVPEAYARSHSISVDVDRGEPGANNASQRAWSRSRSRRRTLLSGSSRNTLIDGSWLLARSDTRLGLGLGW
jgi:hypothetical protein